MKVKIFRNREYTIIESEINKWLEDNENKINTIWILQSESKNKSQYVLQSEEELTISIFYEEIKVKEQNQGKGNWICPKCKQIGFQSIHFEGKMCTNCANIERGLI